MAKNLEWLKLLKERLTWWMVCMWNKQFLLIHSEIWEGGGVGGSGVN